jgi:hypothetical protein
VFGVFWGLEVRTDPSPPPPPENSNCNKGKACIYPPTSVWPIVELKLFILN